MIIRAPDADETPLSPSEAAYLSPTFARNQYSDDYGQKATSTGLPVLPEQGNDSANKCLQPMVHQMRGGRY